MAIKPVSKLLRSFAFSLSCTRKRRLLVSILAPPILGSQIILMTETLTMMLKKGIWHPPSLGIYLTVIVGSYIFMGMQSLLTALVMEYLVRPRANHKLVIILSSCIFGMLAGASISFLRSIPTVMFTGLFAGLILGLILATSFAADQN